MRIGNKEKEIIQLVGTGVFLGASLVFPGLPAAIGPFLLNTKHSRQNLKRSFKSLEEKDLIYLSGDKVKLTKAGLALLKSIESEDITIVTSENWDGIWRIVAYDVPDKSKKERDYFRTKLESLGFVRVQESMFALPFDCKQEIAVFAQSLGISPFVLYLTTGLIPYQDKHLRKYHFENVVNGKVVK